MSVPAPASVRSRAAAVAVRRDPRLHAAVVLPARSGGWRCWCRAPGALLFGLLRSRRRRDRAERAFANVAAEGIFGLVDADRRARSSATRCSAPKCGPARSTSPGCRPTPTWQIVARALARRIVVALVTIAPACALAAVLAGTPESAGAAFVAAAVGSVSLHRDLHRDRMPHATHRGVVAGVRVPRRTAARRRARPASRSCRPRGSRGRSSSACVNDAPQRLVRDGIPQGGARSRPAGDRDGRRARARGLAHAAHAHGGRFRLVRADDREAVPRDPVGNRRRRARRDRGHPRPSRPRARRLLGALRRQVGEGRRRPGRPRSGRRDRVERRRRGPRDRRRLRRVRAAPRRPRRGRTHPAVGEERVDAGGVGLPGPLQDRRPRSGVRGRQRHPPRHRHPSRRHHRDVPADAVGAVGIDHARARRGVLRHPHLRRTRRRTARDAVRRGARRRPQEHHGRRAGRRLPAVGAHGGRRARVPTRPRAAHHPRDGSRDRADRLADRRRSSPGRSRRNASGGRGSSTASRW